MVRADGSLTEAIVTGPAPPKQAPAPEVSAEGPTALVSDPESLHGQATVDLSAALRTAPPAQADASASAAVEAAPLYLRQGEQLYRVDDLPTLQQWVLEKRARPDDELSTGQDDWTPLSEVPAVAPLFRAVRAAPPSSPPRPTGAPSGAAGDLTRASAQAAAPPPAAPAPQETAPAEDPAPAPAPAPGDAFLPGPNRDSLSDLLLSLDGVGAELPEPGSLPQPSDADETEEADLAEVLAMLLEGEEGAAEREANAIRHPSLSEDAPASAKTSAPAEAPAPAGPPTEQLPDDIAALLTGLQSAAPTEAASAEAASAEGEGPAPELKEALDVLPPDISALVSGLTEDAETEEAPRPDGLSGISWTTSDEETETALPPAPSPFADEPFLEMPTDIGNVPYFDEDDEDDAPRTDSTSKWIFLGAILVFAVGIGAMLISPEPETPALGSGGAASAAGSADPAPGAVEPASGSPEAAPGQQAGAGAEAKTDAAAKADADAAKAKADAAAKAKADADAAAKAKASAAAKKKPAAAKRRSSDVRALLSRGWSEVDNGDWSDAREIFTRAAKVSPENGQVHYGLGYIAEKLGSPGEAYREYCVAWAFSTGDIELRREISGRLNVLNRSCD